ncbi:MAG: GNAT family N-acetyltransferase [Candidatus Lokiarchaeota archaeon]|nr:GNAT family N-acetyltransferase [Candidatus Lokiarchaeota archaeon]
MEIIEADQDDAEEILKLQKIVYIDEAQIYNDFTISPLHQTISEIKEEFSYKKFLKASSNCIIIGSVRGYQNIDTCYIGKLIVNSEFQNQGIGSKLLGKIEQIFKEVKRYELFTGDKSEKNLYFYKKNGYNAFKEEKLNSNVNFVFLEKFNNFYL